MGGIPSVSADFVRPCGSTVVGAAQPATAANDPRARTTVALLRVRGMGTPPSRGFQQVECLGYQAEEVSVKYAVLTVIRRLLCDPWGLLGNPVLSRRGTR